MWILSQFVLHYCRHNIIHITLCSVPKVYIICGRTYVLMWLIYYYQSICHIHGEAAGILLMCFHNMIIQSLIYHENWQRKIMSFVKLYCIMLYIYIYSTASCIYLISCINQLIILQHFVKTNACLYIVHFVFYLCIKHNT